MALIPRTECTYLAIRRNYNRRQTNYAQFSDFRNAQQQIHGIRQKVSGFEVDRRPNKPFHTFHQDRDPNVIPFNLRLKKLAKDRNWRAALKCIEEIHQQGLRPDEISYATAIDACSKSFKSKEAVRLFHEMKGAGIRPNVPIYNAVMNACARDHQWKQSLNFLNDMRANGIIPNIVSYNVCLSALEKAKKWSIAVDLMKDIRTSGVPLQVITYNTVISACAKSRKMNVCEEIHQQMKMDGFKPDAFTYSSLLNGYRKVRNWNAMFQVADEMRAMGVPFDAVIYSTVIGACADAGESFRAFQLFEEMKKDGVKPNEIVYSCVLRACDNVPTVDKLLHEMKINGVQKNSVVFTSAINVAHKYGDVSDATRWFDQMLDEGIKPDWVAYMSLFEVLNQSNNLGLLDSYYQQGLKSGVLSHFAKDQTVAPNTTVVDLHGWSTALARAALRNLMQEFQSQFDSGFPVRGLTILTGKGYSKNTPILRPAVTRMLQTEFNPPLAFSVKNGKISIDKATILHWVRTQNGEREPPSLVNKLQVERQRDDAYYHDIEDMFSLIHPRFALRFAESDPLYWSHSVLGRDDSPPPSWISPEIVQASMFEKCSHSV